MLGTIIAAKSSRNAVISLKVLPVTKQRRIKRISPLDYNSLGEAGRLTLSGASQHRILSDLRRGQFQI